MQEQITAAELAELIGTEEQPLLLDVREPDEFSSWAIPGALNVPLGELPLRIEEIPAGRSVVALCASGNRSRQATQFLARRGRQVANLEGGMAAWGQVFDQAVLDLAGARVLQIRRRAKGCLSYLVGAGDAAFVIDPALRPELYVAAAAEQGWRITRVFDTHLHADHLSGARALAELTGATLHLHPAEPFGFSYTPLTDGEHFALPGGAQLSVNVLHTPGHTEGSTIFRLGDEVLLSGDTLFVDGVGRPDLAERAEEFARNLHRSLATRVLPLPDTLLVLPAHYGDSVAVLPGRIVARRLGELRAALPALGLDEPAFVSWAVARLSDRPPNYRSIVSANRNGTALAPAAAEALEAGPNRCSA